MDEYDDYYYDDGRFCDDGIDDELENPDSPTYDELDLEGRYYEYGSRSDYNEWIKNNVQNNATNSGSMLGFIIILIMIVSL